MCVLCVCCKVEEIAAVEGGREAQGKVHYTQTNMHKQDTEMSAAMMMPSSAL